MRSLSYLLLVLLLTSFTYFVEVNEEQAQLSGELQTALDAWLELDDSLSFSEIASVDEAEVVFRVGDAALLGPDSLSLATQIGEGNRQKLILLHPDAIDNQLVLRHELGLLFGLTVKNDGIMNPALSPDDSSDLSEADALQLSVTVNAEKEDINKDGSIDFYDLVALSKVFGSADLNSAADLNEDGRIDNEDLELLRVAYSFSAPSETAPSSDTPRDEFEEALDQAVPVIDTEEVDITVEPDLSFTPESEFASDEPAVVPEITPPDEINPASESVPESEASEEIPADPQEETPAEETPVDPPTDESDN